MSWSVNATGKPADVRKTLEEQFKGPLADKPSGLTDDDERETVQRVKDVIFQTVDTMDAERTVSVSASGHMGYGDWDKKTGKYQQVSLTIS